MDGEHLGVALLTDKDRRAIASEFWSGFVINGRVATWADMTPAEQASASAEWAARQKAPAAATPQQLNADAILQRVGNAIVATVPSMVDRKVAAAVEKLQEAIARTETSTTMKIISLESEFALCLRRGPPIDPDRIAAMEKRIQSLEAKIAALTRNDNG